jgi:4-hydroxythreonine-4-phosphate dehydrogenase
MTLPVALTLGDPAGIGGEIALKAWAALRNGPAVFLIGDIGHLTGLAASLGLAVREIAGPEQALSAMSEGLPVLHHALPQPVEAGRAEAGNAAAVIEIIARAVSLVRAGEALAVVTNPIHKKALQDGAGFDFLGHTEYLAHLSGARRPVMMLVAPGLRVVPVTIHISLADVPRALTAALLEETLRMVHAALVSDFGVPEPRLAVAGLNPHAGEGGAMGREEMTVIGPVLARLRAEGMALDGPRSADTLFHPAARAGYDAAVCMYHDQALIPIKTVDFEGGVNVTLGLDFVRTSPDHGTAYDIAGQNVANPASLIAAIGMAHDLGAQRAARR